VRSLSEPPEGTLMYRRDKARRRMARRCGYLPPPPEKDCPLRPINDCCECCGEITVIFHLDHCHKTGAFRGWVCHACNLLENVDRLEKRVAFLRDCEARKIAATSLGTQSVTRFTNKVAESRKRYPPS
jgi:hypothetical protein